ncbi:hypothetical protein DPMN_040845 [Dreissena polymorpha]|uniref:Resolvase HTH domain-containing protein n=1 Tax=Dreissena polymorpha TaxID=45954 RepID=A0A9D4CXZ1_DREPO|nr:hypothetical protein DPMN_040845 [Dreissena polymorpha]
MKLKTACVQFGSRKPPKSDSKAGLHYFTIPKEILDDMLDIGFTIKEISALFAISESTVYRRMTAYGPKKYNFTDVSDELLIETVMKLTKQYQRCGEKMLREILRLKNIRVNKFIDSD